MEEQVRRLIERSPYATRSKRFSSESQKPFSSYVDYNNRQQEDYSEPQYRRQSHNQAGRIISVNSTKRAFLKKNINKDIKKRYISTDKSEILNNETTDKFSSFKEEIKNRISQIPQEPKKPQVKNRYAMEEYQESDNTQSDHLRSRNDTEYTVINIQNQKQILIDFDTNLFTQAHKVLQELQEQIFVGNTYSLVRRYLQIIATGALDDYSNINLNLHKRKIVKLAILYERISVLLVAFSQVTGNMSAHQNYLSNLLKYVLDNRVIILNILQNRLQKLQIEKTSTSTQSFNNNLESRNFQVLRDNNQIILQTIHKLSVEDNYFYQNLRKFIKGSSTFRIQQCFYFILQYFAFFLHLSGLQQKIPFLAVAPNPYLPPAEKYTLVFDFVQLMYNQKLNNFRPHSQMFIQQMSQFYELVTYSAVFPKQMQQTIKFVDRKNKILHKLYRHHLVKYKSKYQKDLSRLGRPLEKVVLLDVEDCAFNPKNCIKIKKWNGSIKDRALLDISRFLAQIAIKKADTQQEITRYKKEGVLRRVKERSPNSRAKQQ